MICSQCQVMNDSDSLFCSNCGTSLTRSAPGSGGAGTRPQSTILAGPGPGAPGAPGGYYQPGAPADQYPQSPPPGPYGSGDPGQYYSQGAPPGQYPSSAPTSPYSPGSHAPRTRQAQSFHLDLRRLSRVDQTVGGASLVVLISLFLPWYGFTALGSSFTISGTSTHGYLVIDVILAVVLIAYLVLQSGWDKFPVNIPVAHGPLLLIGTGLQFLLVLIGFLDVPNGLSWEIGAYVGLIAAAIAAGPVIAPAIRTWQASR
jgi:hypothetical protein